MYDAKQGVRVVGHTRFKILKIQLRGMSSARWYNFSLTRSTYFLVLLETIESGTIASIATNVVLHFTDKRGCKPTKQTRKQPGCKHCKQATNTLSSLNQKSKSQLTTTFIHSSAPATTATLQQHNTTSQGHSSLGLNFPAPFCTCKTLVRVRQHWTPLGPLFPFLIESSIDRIAHKPLRR
jgi:hypothetical protein